MEGDREHIRLEMESRSSNEEFARVVAAVFMSRLDPTLEEMDDVKTAVSEAVTNAVIHGYREKCGTVVMELTADRTERSLTVEVTDQGTGIEDIKKGHGTHVYHRPIRREVWNGLCFYGSLYGRDRCSFPTRGGDGSPYEKAGRLRQQPFCVKEAVWMRHLS